jgi:DNA polymerase III epsilon subunit-like protein
MYPNTIALARRLSKPIVSFDLEHTGGKGEGRAITDFGAMVVTPDGDVSSYSTLVKPAAGAEFSSYVSRLTGIYPETVEHAPGWEKVHHEFVSLHLGSLWVGFNSRTCDTPLVRKESGRLGHELEPLLQLDLIRVGTLQGRLAERVQQLVPGFDTSGAHRGLKDALMTLTLLEAQLPLLTELELKNQLAPPAPQGPKVPRGRLSAEELAAGRRKLDVSLFLVAPGTVRIGQRNGQPWSDDEIIWVCRQYRGGKKSIHELSELNGRSAYGVACALFKQGIISEEDRDTYKAVA